MYICIYTCMYIYTYHMYIYISYIYIHIIYYPFDFDSLPHEDPSRLWDPLLVHHQHESSPVRSLDGFWCMDFDGFFHDSLEKNLGHLQKSPWTSHYLKDFPWFSSGFQTWKRHLCDFCPAQVLPRLRAVMRTMSWKSLTCCRKSLQRRFSAGAKNPFSGRSLNMSLGGRTEDDQEQHGATWSNR